MTTVWRIRPKQDPLFQLVIDYPEDIEWHTGTFSGDGVGIIDSAGPSDLVEHLKLDEITDIHKFIWSDLRSFFDSGDIAWAYTGGTKGEVPDFIGFSSPRTIHIGEIKWGGGWLDGSKGLENQIARYSGSGLWGGNTNDMDVVIHIACPKTPSRAGFNALMTSPTTGKWRSVRFQFGFLQPGWLRSDPTQQYLRIGWIDGDRWNGKDFNGWPYPISWRD